MKYVIVAVGVGFIAWLLLRSRKTLAAERLPVRKDNGQYGPAYATPPIPLTAELNGTRARPSQFQTDCNGFLKGSGDIAISSGNPKAAAAGLAAKTGAPYACAAVDIVSDITSKATGLSKGKSVALTVAAPLWLPNAAIYAGGKKLVAPAKKIANLTSKGAGALAGAVATGARKLCFFC